MLNIKKFIVNPLQENCYVVSDDTHDCVIIDCGAFFPEERSAIVSYIRENKLTPRHLLQTHAHIDHYIGADTINKEFALLPEVHLNEQQQVEHLGRNCQYILGVSLETDLPPVGRYFTAADTITFGSHELTILETPGHSPGSVFFLCKEEKVAFSGDTLFRGSIGRTDFEGGSMFQIIQSLRMICQLDDDIRVYPGHGAETTIGYECAHNPYIDR